VSHRSSGKAYKLAGSEFHFRHFTWFQYLEAAPIEKECVIPEHLGQLRDRWMVISKNLSVQFAQRLFYLLS
jgi:hypothetical protein